MLALLAVVVVAGTFSWATGRIGDPSAPDMVQMCAELEVAAAASAPTLPERLRAAAEHYRVTGEQVPVFAPTPCLPGWQSRHR